MSGGVYDYLYENIEDLADRLNPVHDKYQPLRKRLALALRGIAKVCQVVEWIDSCDYGEDDWKTVEVWLDGHNFLSD